jgi:hypothetical protein
MKNKPSKQSGSRRRGRCVPGLDPLEDRRLLSLGAGLTPHAFSSPIEVAPISGGLHEPGPVPGHFQSYPSAEPHSLDNGGAASFDRFPGHFALSFELVIAVGFRNGAMAPAGHNGPPGPMDREAIPPDFLSAPSFSLGRNDPAARPAPPDSTSVDRPGAPVRMSSPADLLPISASAGLIIFLNPATPNPGVVGKGAVPSPTLEVGNAGRPIGAGLSDTSQDLPTPGSFKVHPPAPVPDVPRTNEPEAPSLGDAGARSSPQEVAPLEVPQPRGADLISESAPFDQAALDRAITRLRDWFEHLGKPLNEEVGDPWSLLPVITALVAFEAARRWRARQQGTGTIRVAKTPSSILRGFF